MPNPTVPDNPIIRKTPGRPVKAAAGRVKLLLASIFVLPWGVSFYLAVKAMDQAGWLWWAHSLWFWLRASVVLVWWWL